LLQFIPLQEENVTPTSDQQQTYSITFSIHQWNAISYNGVV